MPASNAQNNPERIPGFIWQDIAVAAATTVYVGTIAAVDAAGNVKPASDTAALRVVGRCEGVSSTATAVATAANVIGGDAINAGAAGDVKVNLKRGVFRFDNYASDLVTTVDVELGPGERALVPTGIAIALPVGFAGFVHPRSGLAVDHGVGLVNAPGTIDAGYRGELKVVLVNHDPRETVRQRRLDRIAQLVVQQVEQVQWRETGELPASERGTGGHGSTGGHSAGGA